MDYAKVYIKFISDRKAKENNLKASGAYYEKHHITPRDMGGGDDPANLIALTAGDHYFAHLLLACAHGGRHWLGVQAMANMPGATSKRDFVARRRWVDLARENSSKFHSEKAKLQHKDPEYLKKLHSVESKAKRAAKMAIILNSPQNIERQRAVMAKNIANESFILARGNAVREYWSKQENRDVLSKRWKENQPMHNPAIRDKVSLAMVAYCAQPEVKEHRSKLLSQPDHPIRSEAAKKKSMAIIKAKREANPDLWVKVPVVVGGITMGLSKAAILLSTSDSNIRKLANQRGTTVQDICDWYAATTKDERMAKRTPRSGFVTYEGKSWTKKELCEKYGISYWTVLDRSQKYGKEWIDVFGQMACVATKQAA